jgi:hypothetical protein
MRKCIVFLVFVLAFAACAMAQIEPPRLEAPKTEFFLGYAYQRADTSGSNLPGNGLVNVSSTNLNGFAFEFSHYLHGKFGYTVDVARGSNSAVDSTGIKYLRTSYMAGPTYRLHEIGFFTPSIHVLAGVDHDSFTIPSPAIASTFTQTDLAFAAAAGVTFDANLSRHLAVRLAQVDYLYTQHYSTNQSSFRYSGGVVVRF